MTTSASIPWLAASLAALVLSGCFADGRDDDDDDDDDAAELTDLEWSMVGTWRGSLPDDRWAYYVFDADRTGCTWEREGDDFGRRFAEVKFTDWQLVADEIDGDLRMPLEWRFPNGDVFDDTYDLANDRILQSGLTELPVYWIDVRIDCDDTGTNATESDVERLGSLGNGLTGGGDPIGSTTPGTYGQPGNPGGGGGGGGGGGQPTGGTTQTGPTGGGGTTGGGTSTGAPTGGGTGSGSGSSTGSGSGSTGGGGGGPAPP